MEDLENRAIIVIVEHNNIYRTFSSDVTGAIVVKETRELCYIGRNYKLERYAMVLLEKQKNIRYLLKEGKKNPEGIRYVSSYKHYSCSGCDTNSLVFKYIKVI